jgi:MFS superfamily sulfate permease-like transporter
VHQLPAMTKQGNFTDGWIDFFHSHQTLAIAVAVGVVVFAYFKPKHTLKLVGAVAILVAIAYVLSFLVNLTSTGIDETTKFKDSPQIKSN